MSLEFWGLVLAVVLPAAGTLFTNWVRSDTKERVASAQSETEKRINALRLEVTREYVRHEPHMRDLRDEMKTSNEKVIKKLTAIQRTVDRRFGGNDVDEEDE